ncbi:MAG: alpha/beta hydrolase-fold protein [Hafnia sp.]
MLRYLLGIIVALLPFISAANPDTASSPYQIPDTQIFTFHSPQNGDYKIMVYVPKTKPSAQGWPVMYILDGDTYFAQAASLLAQQSCARCALEPGVIVAIGYDGKSRRDRDYRPHVQKIAQEHNPQGGTYPTGAAGQSDLFFAFIEDELKPDIAQRFPIDKQRQGLFGHSYGGLFTIDMATKHPQSFTNWFASSPSVWWNQRYLQQQAEQFLVNKRPMVSPSGIIRLSVGGDEQTLQPFEQKLPEEKQAILKQHRAQRAMVDGVKTLNDTLKKIDGYSEKVSFQCYPHQSHISVSSMALSDALKIHFAR